MRAALCLPALVLATAAAAENHVVSIENMKFQPPVITVQRGDTVTWRNTDMVPHTATAPGRFDSGNIAAGQSWSWKADASGRFEYVCTYHRGMKAAVVVR